MANKDYYLKTRIWVVWALCLTSGKYPTFFIWNFIVERTSSTFCTMLSLCVSAVGNLPALFRPGPRIRGICLIRLSEARKASYFLATNREKITLKSNAIKFFHTKLLLKKVIKWQSITQLPHSDNKKLLFFCTYNFINWTLWSETLHGQNAPSNGIKECHEANNK